MHAPHAWRAPAQLTGVACSGVVRAQSMLVKGEAPASVQCGALRALGTVLGSIAAVPPSDAKIFNECARAQQPSTLLLSCSCPCAPPSQAGRRCMLLSRNMPARGACKQAVKLGNSVGACTSLLWY